MSPRKKKLDVCCGNIIRQWHGIVEENAVLRQHKESLGNASHDNGIEEVGGSIPPGSTSHFAKTGESPGAITAHGRSLGGSLGPA
jgi:hypothetical protein